MVHIVQRSKYITLFRSKFQFLSNPLQHTCRILTVYRHRCFQTCRNMVIISIIIIIKLRIGERRRSLHSFRTAFSCQYQRPIELLALLRIVRSSLQMHPHRISSLDAITVSPQTVQSNIRTGLLLYLYLLPVDTHRHLFTP